MLIYIFLVTLFTAASQAFTFGTCKWHNLPEVKELGLKKEVQSQTVKLLLCFLSIFLIFLNMSSFSLSTFVSSYFLQSVNHQRRLKKNSDLINKTNFIFQSSRKQLMYNILTPVRNSHLATKLRKFCNPAKYRVATSSHVTSFSTEHNREFLKGSYPASELLPQSRASLCPSKM